MPNMDRPSYLKKKGSEMPQPKKKGNPTEIT